jgi:hypothetical protein
VTGSHRLGRQACRAVREPNQRRGKGVLAEPAVIERLRELGSDTRPTTSEGFKERVTDDVTKWTKVVADAKIPKV